MSTHVDSANLIVRLYELRQESELRQAHEWYFHEFDPVSADDVFALWMGARSGVYRLLTGYWEMAATLVAHGSIDATMFHEANTDHFAVMAKLGPHLPGLRQLSGLPDYMLRLQQVVESAPDAERQVEWFRNYFRARAQQQDADHVSTRLGVDWSARAPGPFDNVRMRGNL